MGKEDKIATLKIGGRKLTGSEYLGDVDDILTTNVKTLLDKLGIAYIKKLEEMTPVVTGNLQSSFEVIGVKEVGNVMRLEIAVKAGYSDYIDKGVKGIQNRSTVFKRDDGKYYQFKNYYMPPEALKSLEGWARRKNIELEGAKAIDIHHGRPNVSKLVQSPAARLAYFIKKYGIDGSNFKKRAYDAVLPDFKVKIEKLTSKSMYLKLVK